MRAQIFALLLAIAATTNVVQGQLTALFQDEVEEFAKEVNQLAAASNTRESRQHNDDGYEYPLPSNPLPLPSRTVVSEEHHEEHHHHDDHHGAHSHIHVTRLDVTCDTKGMSVELEFDGSFNGVIYSKGHYKNRKCRFVNKDSARGDFRFTVPMDDCGTVGDDRREDHESILIIQNEESVQEVWDSAKRIRCPKVVQERKKITKTVSFNPFSVLRLDIDEPKQEDQVAETNIECWMDIQVGDNPCGSAVKDRVKIGDQLSAVIYIKDGGAQYDILVKDCFAHDTEDLNAKNVSSIQLSDARGCPKKEKLMGLFKKSEQTCSSGADIVAFAPISAFKFADRSDVFLTCIVELCPGGCDQCPAGSTTVNIIQEPPFKCTPALVGRDSRCPAPVTEFVCTPNLVGRDRRCPVPRQNPPIITTPKTTTPFVCTPRLVGRDPRCPAPITPTTQKITTTFVCTPQLVGRDRRCPAPITPTTQRITTQRIVTAPFICTPQLVGRDPRCPAPSTPTTQRITTQRIVTTPFVCTPQLVGRDPRCPAPSTPTTQRITTQRITTQFVCTPQLVGRDRRCPAPITPTTQRITTPFSCTPALVGRDPRCPPPTTPIAPTTPRFVCTPELMGNDARCPATGASFVRVPSKTGICEFNPTAPGCGLTQDGLEHHAFHKWQAAAGKGTRRRPDGRRPVSSPNANRSKREVSKNIVITGVSTGYHYNRK